ncbi:hypothetical protein F5B22DRAFT_640858 [Xylaria bambusicola]|uniref:uncharacterized protein n=1 Tax=Xylaria bambusicola TaxID=326684 RepID=UPI0020088900|nr:uncharacterized protein F5B22DRAFT_640858 [Xylaria bambusicola]KAI0527882.1 hypothetical protein F5B22DRAFT_640858 [Xylaria bambusicola]
MAIGTTAIEPNTIKRPIEQDGDREPSDPVKKRRLSGARTEPPSPQNEKPLQEEAAEAPRPRSISPEDSSLFDNSTIENSQVTVISEPDIETTVAPAATENRPRQGSMTREEARQKVEILRLRLGLASYKVKTNQTDVPLERLQKRPIPGRVTKKTPTKQIPPTTTLSSTLQATSVQCLAAMAKRNEQQRLSSPARIERASPRNVVPPVSSHSRNGSGSSVTCIDANESPSRTQESEQRLPPEVLSTPQQRLPKIDDKFEDSERGGAAEGLLSLSQSSPASMFEIKSTPK